MKQVDLDIWYVQAWTMFFQWVFGLIMFPIVLIPLPAPYESLRIKEVPMNVWRGMKCTVGINSVPSDKCGYFWAVLLVFLCFNLAFNYLMLYVMKYGSSTLAVVAATARIAISNVAFLIPFVAGEAVQRRLTYFDIMALIILLAGVVLYSVTKERRNDKGTIVAYASRLFYRATPTRKQMPDI
jgi:hypothetical protein